LTTSPPGQTEGNMVKGLAKYLILSAPWSVDQVCWRKPLLAKRGYSPM